MSDASAHEPGPQPSRSLLSRLPTPVKAVLVGAGVVSAVSVGYEVVDTANDAAVSVTESAVSSINDGDLALARQVARDVLPSPSDLTSPPVQTFGVTAAVGVVALRSRRKSRKGPAAEALAGQLVATVEPVSYPADASVDAPRLESQQLTFITPALFTGAIAERIRFTPFVFLILIWSILVYAPVAHWVFSPNGWLFQRGAQDFAGGTVVHINAGAAALALVLVIGKRKGFGTQKYAQSSLPFVLLGAGMLWFGWFGFNAGSALGANQSAAWAFINTNTAAGAAVLGWIFVERFQGGKATTFGVASGAIAGLVAITPAAGYVKPVGAIAIGLLAGLLCCVACRIKFKAGYDDALDVVGIHLVGGLVGALAIGFLGTSEVGGVDGLFYGGGAGLLGEQALAVAVVFAYSFVATLIIAKVLDLAFTLRVTDEDEEAGLDASLHGEVAYGVDNESLETVNA